ncbi:MAG TPA: hypothetical protein VGR24_05625 [bacterium]|jgi:hypothetical protein|nr:hypothetical protein [bacterium]
MIAYPGTDPRRDLRKAPRGLLFVYNAGLAFLAAGEQTGFTASELVDLLAGEAAKQAMPFGGCCTPSSPTRAICDGPNANSRSNSNAFCRIQIRLPFHLRISWKLGTRWRGVS